jgi:hypothetical protein
MEPLIYVPTYELFFVLEPMRSSFRELLGSLRTLDGPEAPALLGVDAYYRADTDVALLALRFDERTLSYRELTWVLELAGGRDIPTLDPSRLPEDDRRQFYQSYLSSYGVRVEDTATVADALGELGARLGLIARRASTHTEAPKRIPTTPPQADAAERPPPASVPRGRAPRGKLSLAEQAAFARASARDRAPTARLPGSADAREITRADTPRARTDRGIGAAGAQVTVTSADATQPNEAPRLSDDTPLIAVRVMRSGQWGTARLGALSNRAAYVITTALPHRGELVQLALGFRDIGAMVMGRVSHVTTVDDAAETGQTGFAVKFDNAEDAARMHLLSLLRQARKEGVRLKPPPPRSAVRYPVRWPVHVGPTAGGIDASALDVSNGGLFVATDDRLGSELLFRLPLDTSDRTVHGRAAVVRKVGIDMARARGLTSGYGLRIVDLSRADRRRYGSFLRRVHIRTEKRVIIGASPERIEELTVDLSSAGYTVAGGSDAASLLQLAEGSARPPDVMIIDASLAAFGLNVQWIQQLFAGRRVPCVKTTEGDRREARREVDRVLSIAA